MVIQKEVFCTVLMSNEVSPVMCFSSGLSGITTGLKSGALNIKLWLAYSYLENAAETWRNYIYTRSFVSEDDVDSQADEKQNCEEDKNPIAQIYENVTETADSGGRENYNLYVLEIFIRRKNLNPMFIKMKVPNPK